ncbi:unnamed protein product [Tenebrio molitor]|nr:unnamed protein product [Tenebrio molitor]
MGDAVLIENFSPIVNPSRVLSTRILFMDRRFYRFIQKKNYNFASANAK